MKTQRRLIILIASILMSALSLSITFTATSSSRGAAPDGFRNIVLTVRVVDNNGNEVSGAAVVVFQGDQRLGSRDSDTRGIAQLNIVVNTDRAVELVIEVSKPGMEDRKYTRKLGTNFPTRLPLEDIELKPGASRAKVVLTVKVVDNQNKAIQVARVNVYTGFRDSSWLVSPPTYQDFTNANGIATFEIPVRPGEIPDLRLEVSREDMSTERRVLNLGAGFPTHLPLETFVLTTRASDNGLPTANIRVNVKDDQGNNLEGALVALTSREQTPSQRNTPHQRSTGPDGSATVAIELMSAEDVEYIGVTVSKRGYKEFKDVMEVNNKWNRAVGKTFDYAKPITLVKLPDAFEVRVTVRDSSTNNGVPDAEVILDGPDYATNTTNTEGVVTLAVEKPGSYAVRISQDNYRPVTDGEVRVLKGEKLTVAEPFHLQPRRTKDEAGDTIEITVLGKDSVDADSKTQPLKRATVTDGRFTMSTDDNGRVILRGAYDGSQHVTVTANNYKPLTRKVAINKFLPLSKGTGSATFILEPELSASSPIRLVVEVFDAATNNKINQAFVYAYFVEKGKEIQLATQRSDEKGEASLTLEGSDSIPLSKLRSGIRIYGKTTRHKLTPSDVIGQQLLPSLEPRRLTIFLERDWDGIRKEIEALEAKVNAWKYGKASDPAQEQQFIEKATSELQDARALFKEFEAVAKTLPELTFFGTDASLCTRTARLQMDIRSCESKVNTKASELEQTLKDAAARAPKCSSPAEAEGLRASYRKAIQLLGEIGKLKNHAVKDQEGLSNLVHKASAAQRALAKMKDKATGLQTLALAAKQNESNATAYINRKDNLKGSSTSVQLTLKAELAVLTVKVEAETGVPADLLQRISWLQQALATATMVTATPLPAIVTSAPTGIAQLEESANAKIAESDRSVCPVITLDEAVEGIKKKLDDASYEVAFANDLPTHADVCVARTAKRTDGSTAPGSTGDKADEEIVNTPGAVNQQPTNKLPEDKIEEPTKPADKTIPQAGSGKQPKPVRRRSRIPSATNRRNQPILLRPERLRKISVTQTRLRIRPARNQPSL